MKVRIEIPYTLGTGEMARLDATTMIVKVKKKEMMKAVAKRLNGEIVDGQIIAGNGEPVTVDFSEIMA